jgi:hypothetical protein
LQKVICLKENDYSILAFDGVLEVLDIGEFTEIAGKEVEG